MMEKSKQAGGANGNSQSRSRDQDVREVLKAFVWWVEQVMQCQERRCSHEEETIFNQH